VEVLQVSDTDKLFCCVTGVAGCLGVSCNGAEGDGPPGLCRAWNCLQTVEVRMVMVRRRKHCCVREWMAVDADPVRLSLQGCWTLGGEAEVNHRDLH
jgi:hypothetical protein